MPLGCRRRGKDSTPFRHSAVDGEPLEVQSVEEPPDLWMFGGGSVRGSARGPWTVAAGVQKAIQASIAYYVPSGQRVVSSVFVL